MTPEGKISKQIQDHLRAMGWKVMRLNSGVVRVRGGMLHGCPKGTPDILAFDRSGRLLWLEIKAAMGKPSPEQHEFAVWAKESQHRYLLVRSVEELHEFLEGK